MTTPSPDKSVLPEKGKGPGPEGWKKKVIHLLVGSNDPLRDALSFATGFASAFLPPFGFHSILVAFLAYLFRLSLPIGLLGSWTNNPWTFVPVFLPAYLAEIKIGAIILNIPVQVPNIRALSRMPKEAILAQVKIVLYPFVVGSGLFALGAFLLSFPTIYLLIRWIKARRHPSPP